MSLELELALGRLSLAQGVLDVAIAFLLFVLLRLANRWHYRIERRRDDKRELERLREENRERNEREWEAQRKRRKRS